MPVIDTKEKERLKALFKHSGVCVNTKTIDDYLADIKNLVKHNNAEIEKLKAENAHLKSEAYKDAEMADMQKKVDRANEERKKMSEDYYRGFPLSKEESEAIYAWQRQHDKEEHGNEKGYHGAIGGGFTYEFVPTSIGTVGECVCGTCHTKALMRACAGGNYIKDIYNSYMKEHNGSFIFQDL